MKSVTYSLKADEKNLENYYTDVSSFTDIILTEAENLIEPITEEFQFYLVRSKGEILRSKSEYIFELLTLGTLIRAYERNAINLSILPQRILVGLASLRQKYPGVKTMVDPIRGILISLFLIRKKGTIFSKGKYGVEKIGKLLEWLAASGDFKQEVKRLKIWKEYFSFLPTEKALEYIFAAMDYAKWFEMQSKIALGKYTVNLSKFFEYKFYTYKWREDIIFCGRKEVEYHLNMVGAEIMNRAWRDEFLNTKRKAVLVPACMRTKNNFHCKWVYNGIDYSCTGCTKGCHVNQLTKIGKEVGFDVFMIPHSTDFTKWLSKRAGNKEVGIIGVTCALNLMTGGWEAKSLDIPINCVLLDYCGCKNHWDEKGFPTAINMNELMRILQKENVNIAFEEFNQVH
jgi:uncharacterized protein